MKAPSMTPQPAVLRPLLVAIAAALLLAVTALPSPAGPLSGTRAQNDAPTHSSTGVGIRLLDIPTETRDDPRAQSYIVDHVEPGETVERRIEVANRSSSPQAVRVYAAAARIVDGSFQPYDESPNELSTWITTDPRQVELGPDEQAESLVTIRIPEDAAEGEQYAAVWAEVRGSEEKQGEVALAHRAGVRVYLSVGGGNGPPADFSIGTMTAGRDDDGNPVVTAEVTNTGGRAVDLTGELSLAEGPGGVSAGPFAMDGGATIAPKGRSQVRVVLDPELPAGTWTGTLELTSGLLSRETTGELTFSETGPPAPVETGTFAWWWIAAAIVLALLLFVGALWRRRARRATAASVRE
ncbi:hypothetical protein ACH9EU_03900 [Kocuria sp. M1R5S2]|uniref:hypothetical protein n=1 Tax=Kocuria rhizosphaerae TaxID=3376285 RepID=UPI0037B0115F